MTISLLFLIAAICFVLSLKGLSSPDSAVRGNFIGIFGMILACAATYLSISPSFIPSTTVVVIIGGCIGIFIARSVSMTSLPQMVAGFHSLVGLAAVLVAFSAFYAPSVFKILSPDGSIYKSSLIEMGLGAAIGAITFTGSIIAFLKLQDLYQGHRIPQAVNAFFISSILCLLLWFVFTQDEGIFIVLSVLSLILGCTLIAPIGGADMPVVVSMLNSYSGWATSGIGFTLNNDLLIITGALVGSSGAILSYIMCKGMNRSLVNVIFAREQSAVSSATDAKQSENRPYTKGSAEDAAFILKNAQNVIIVPGYGMATSQSQYVLKEMGDILKSNGVSVKYAIHPVAGRMPGHMNVLLAEAKVPYEDVFEFDDINSEFNSCDVAYIVGANDITNPAAKDDPTSSIYGMPVFDVDRAKTVLFLKRSMGAGYAGVDNELFYANNTMMLLGDAKKTTETIIKFM